MILFQNVTKTYKGHEPAVNNVSCDIGRGEFVFVVGPSGSGKSTFLRLMTRQETPEVGSIHISGQDVLGLSRWRIPALRREIGCVFQDYKLLPNKTVKQNVEVALEVIGSSRSRIRSQVPAILDLVGLAHKMRSYPDELSGGEQQRVSIARAFVNKPKILLADEPTGNLDPNTSQGIMQLLSRINQIGTTVVMATHDHSIVDQMQNRVLELERGRLVRDQARGVYG